MSDMSEAAWLWAAKGAGAVAGSAISLAYILPHGRREAALRFAVGTVCGLVFGGTVGLKVSTELGLAQTIGQAETVLMGSAIASLCAWWALGFIARSFEQGVFGRKAPDGVRAERARETPDSINQAKE
ncbi:MAG: DUF6107 family protein [Mesorhizobium sp.]